MQIILGDEVKSALVTEHKSLSNGESKIYSVNLTLTEEVKGGFIAIQVFSQNQSLINFELGDVKVDYSYIPFNKGNVGGYFTPSANNSDLTLSVENSSDYTDNVIGTASYTGTASGTWRGIAVRLSDTFEAGNYTLSFKVKNSGTAAINMYSELLSHNGSKIVASKVTEHNSISVNEYKTYSVTLTVSEDVSGFIQLAVFSMNATDIKFELGDVKADYSYIPFNKGSVGGHYTVSSLNSDVTLLYLSTLMKRF